MADAVRRSGDTFSGTVNFPNNNIIAANGSVGIGNTAPKAPLTIGAANGTFTNPLVQAASSANSWLQINAQNINPGNNASTDLVLARNDGTDTSNFIDVGINSNNYNQAGYSIMSPGSGYVFTNGGDLSLGTQTAHNILFHAGNTTTTAERMRINANGHVGIGNNTPYNASWSANSIQLCIGNYNVAYGSVHLSGGSTSNTSYSFGVGDGNYYMAYDNAAQQHRMITTSTGAVRMPFQPHARASRNSGAIGYNSVIIFNYADDDIAGMYNTTTGRFTAPVTGRYLFAHGMFTSQGNSAWLKWRVNGVAIASTYSAVTSNYASVAGSIVLRMNANDYADLWVDSGSAAYSIYGNDRTQCWATFTLLG